MDNQEMMSRRRFFNRITIALASAAAAVLSVPVIAYLLSPIINPSRTAWLDLGPIDLFEIGETVQANLEDPSPVAWAGQTATTAVWVRRVDPTEFIVFAVNCTHLGCPVSWVADAALFVCPCHGGVYYSDGRVAGGPPPRPLFRYVSRVENDHLFVQTRPLPIIG